MKVIIPAVMLLTLIACDSNKKSAEEIQAEIAASQKQFEENRKRIEAENKAREEKLALQRSYISVAFNQVDENYLEVSLSNTTSKAIDNLVGSLEVLDAEGNIVTSTALTNWVPGDVYLPVGAQQLARKSLSLETPEKRSQILSQASTYSYRYTVLRIQFVGEEELNYFN